MAKEKVKAKSFAVEMDDSENLKIEKVTCRKVTAGDMLTAQRVTGESSGAGFILGVIAEVCKFDGKKLTYEDLQKLAFDDFLALQGDLMELGWMGSSEQLSSFAERFA